MPQNKDNEEIEQGLISIIGKLIWVIVVLAAGNVIIPFALNYLEKQKK